MEEVKRQQEARKKALADAEEARKAREFQKKQEEERKAGPTDFLTYKISIQTCHQSFIRTESFFSKESFSNMFFLLSNHKIFTKLFHTIANIKCQNSKY